MHISQFFKYQIILSKSFLPLEFAQILLKMGFENQLVITLPHSRVLKLIARSVLLSVAIISFPWVQSYIANSLQASHASMLKSNSDDSILLPSLFQDLLNEGLFKVGNKAMFVSSEANNNVDDHRNHKILIDNDIHMVSEFDEECLSSIAGNSLDFVISSGYSTTEFIDRSLKIGGVLVVQLNNDPSKAFKRPANYKIVYLRRFDSTVVAMRKIFESVNLPGQRRLLAYESEAKKLALNGLEDVVLEPPQGSTAFKKYSRKTKFLPELTGDTLDGYPRRVFIDVALPGKSGSKSSIQWFKKNYPTRNRLFDIYNIEMVAEESSEPQVGVSDWLNKNVKEEEYVVMKAEADVAEEMISSRAITLVDELFLECKHQWQKGKKNKGKRAYWECLSLYGRLRDEGVAVHQWWG